MNVSQLGLGLAPIGGLFAQVGETQALATVDRGWELGVRLFDTAPLYGFGRSEALAGKALGPRPRADYTISTKVGRLLVPGEGGPSGIWAQAPADVVARFDFTADGVRQSLVESLERIGLEQVDIVFLHDPDEHMEQALFEALPELVSLRDDGVIREIGAGMNDAGLLSRIIRETKAGDIDRVLMAGRYTLLDRRAEEELLPLCLEKGVRVTAAGVFNSGVLADPSPGATYDYAPASEQVRARALAMQEACARYGVPLGAAAVQFPLRHPAVTHVLVGVRSPEEVDAAVDNVARELPEELWHELG